MRGTSGVFASPNRASFNQGSLSFVAAVLVLTRGAKLRSVRICSVLLRAAMLRKNVARKGMSRPEAGSWPLKEAFIRAPQGAQPEALRQAHCSNDHAGPCR